LRSHAGSSRDGGGGGGDRGDVEGAGEALLSQAVSGLPPSAASVEIAKAAGIALARARDVDAKLTVDALVMATAALLDAVLVTGDGDVRRLLQAATLWVPSNATLPHRRAPAVRRVRRHGVRLVEHARSA